MILTHKSSDLQRGDTRYMVEDRRGESVYDITIEEGRDIIRRTLDEGNANARHNAKGRHKPRFTVIVIRLTKKRK